MDDISNILLFAYFNKVEESNLLSFVSADRPIPLTPLRRKEPLRPEEGRAGQHHLRRRLLRQADLADRIWSARR